MGGQIARATIIGGQIAGAIFILHSVNHVRGVGDAAPYGHYPLTPVTSLARGTATA